MDELNTNGGEMDIKTERLTYLIKHAQEKHAEEYIVIAVPGFMGKKFVGYCSMKEDMELVLEYIRHLRGDSSGIIKTSLTYALIALYGKCFTNASKNSFPKLEPSDLFINEEQKSETHDYLMELRHEFIAHRGETDGETGISFMLIPKTGDLDKSQIRFTQLKQASFSEEDLNKIEDLVKFLVEKLMDKIQKSAEKVHKGMLSVFSPEQLQFMVVNNSK